MPASFAPPPGTPSLSGDGGPVNIDVTTAAGGAYSAFIRLPDGSILRIDVGTLSVGKNRLRLVLPPGGVPPGSVLTVAVMEGGAGGGASVANYPI